LAYAKKLTQEPSMVEDADIEELRTAGWDEQGIYEATALISFFNYTGRIEAASKLPMDRIPQGAQFPEATPGKPTVTQLRAHPKNTKTPGLTVRAILGGVSPPVMISRPSGRSASCLVSRRR
jgi:hypothetical protein